MIYVIVSTVQYNATYRDTQLIYWIMSFNITTENDITFAEAVLWECEIFFRING